FARVPLLLSMICRGIAGAEKDSKNALEAAARKLQFDNPTRTTLYRELFLDRLGQDDATVLADQRLQVLANMSVMWLKESGAAAAAAATDDVMLHLLDPSWRGVTPCVAGELNDPLQMLSKIQLDPDPFHLKLFTVVKWLAEIKPSSALEADVTQVTRRLIDLL